MMTTKGTSLDILNDGLGEMQASDFGNPFPQLYQPRLDVFADFRVFPLTKLSARFPRS
jgi:hypothetical protein